MIRVAQWGPAVVATVGTEATTLLRQVLVARLAGADTLGTLMLLMILLRALHMGTDLAADRYLLSRTDSEVPGALKTVHQYGLMRAGLCAAALLIILPLLTLPISPLAVGALVAAFLLKGLVHQGYRLQQRTLQFHALLSVEMGPAWFALALLGPLMTVLSPMDAVAVSFLAQQLTESLQSWRYRGQTQFQPFGCTACFRSFATYGAPLLITSAVLFFSMQGERLVLGFSLPLEVFTPIAAAVQLALLPSLLLGRIMLVVMLPWMRSLTTDALSGVVTRTALILLPVSILGAGLFGTLANWGMEVLYGFDAAVSMPLLGLIALVQMGRVLRAPDSIAAQSISATRIPLYGNLLRAIAILVMGTVLASGGTLTWAFLMLLGAEISAFLLQRRLLMRALGTVSTSPALSPLSLNKEALS